MIRIEARPSGRRHVLFIYDGEVLLHTDTVDIHKAQDRERVINGTLDRHQVDRAELARFLHATVEAVVLEEDIASTGALTPTTSRYAIEDGRMTLAGDPPTVLSNFVARIVEEQVLDDGIEHSRQLVLAGELEDGTTLPDVTVPAADFSNLEWVLRSWGARAVIAAGHAFKDHLRAAIQVLSHDVRTRRIFQHTGWREIDGLWVYLHAGGAIGANGLRTDVTTELPPALQRYVLPEPPLGQDLVNAVRASLRLLDVAADRISVPLMASPFAAILGGTDFSIHLVGPSGTFKTSAAALAMQHFGCGMDATHVPASWSSTANSLEGLAFFAKDALLQVDDFVTIGSHNQIQSTHRDADRLFRAQGNQSGRQRMRPDGTIRPVKPPRGLIISTGEEVPRGQSLGARILVLDVAHGDVRRERLTAAQRDASSGLYAASLAGLIRWLAPQYADFRRHLPARMTSLRESLQQEGLHLRTSGIAAQLLLSMELLLQFAQSCGALEMGEAATILNRCRVALQQNLSRQLRIQSETDPVQIFLSLVQSALTTGSAHLQPIGAPIPRDPELWGWRRTSGSPSGYTQSGIKIGWIHGEDLYLDKNIAFGHAQHLAREQGEVLSVSLRTLMKRLFEQHLLVVEESQDTNTHRLPSPLRDFRGLRLRPGALTPDNGSPAGECRFDGPDPPTSRGALP
jgi:hypothetical protein